MSAKEIAEQQRLHRLWATRKATSAQIMRCMDLDRKAAADGCAGVARLCKQRERQK